MQQPETCTRPCHKVLVVDDEPEIVKEISSRFVTEGYEVLRATGGNEATELIATCRPDLLLTDLRMLNGNGFDLIHRVRQLPQPRPVIFCMTAYNDLDSAEAFEHGIDLFLSKPFDLTLLIKATRHFLTEREELVRVYSDMSLLLDSLPGIVFVVRANGDIVQGNLAARMLAHLYSSVTRRPNFQCLVSSADADDVDGMLEQSNDNRMHCWSGKMNLGGETPASVEVFFTNGLWQNEPVKFVMVADVSRQTAELTQLQTENQALKDRAAEKEKYISAVYHEMRNTLTVLAATGTLLKEIPLEPRATRFVSRISSATAHLICVLHDLSDLSALESGRLLINFETFSVPDFLASLADETCGDNIAVRQRIFVNCDEQLTGDVFGPMARLRQVLQNIVCNSLKYGNESTVVSVRACLADRRDDTLLVDFVVRDTGAGIPVDEVGRVFEPFFRGARKANECEGSGLGLFVCKRLVQLMGGSISLTSDENTGTTVQVRVPLKILPDNG